MASTWPRLRALIALAPEPRPGSHHFVKSIINKRKEYIFGIGYFSCGQSAGIRIPRDPVETLDRTPKNNLESVILLKELRPDT